jgi:hypothetical protein
MTATIDNVTSSGLPAEFSDLELFVAWILETQPERYGRRLASSMDEMQAFYDTMFPRFPEVIEYCNQFELDDLPEPVRKLMWLSFSLIEVSFPIECWRQARVPDSGSASMDCIREPLI